MKSEINIPFEIDVVEDKVYTCHIPFYNIHYDAKTKDDIERKGKIFVKSFINALVEENNK